MSSGGASTPPPPSFPVSPILAKWPIGYYETSPGQRVPVFPDLNFLKAYQQLWAAIQGSGGIIDIVGLLIALAEAPPFEYSSPQMDALVNAIVARQVPADPALPVYAPYIPEDAPVSGYTPLLPQDAGAGDLYTPFLPQDAAPAATPYVPTITFATPGDLTVAYSAQKGEYVVLGNVVLFNANVTFTPTFTTASGAIRVSAPVSAGAQITAAPLSADPGNVTWPASATTVTASIAASTGYFGLNGLSSGIAAAALGAAHYLTATAYTIQITGCYFKA